MKIIGITGYAKTGKDAVGEMLRVGLDNKVTLDKISNNILCDDDYLYATHWHIHKFTEPLKQVLYDLIPTKHYCEYEELKTKEIYPGVTGREMLQFVGTEIGRKLYPNIWVDLLIDSLNPNSQAIITDVRFPNEVEAIKAKGGIIIRKMEPIGYKPMEHESESYIKELDYNFMIPWFDTMEELREYMKEFLSVIYKYMKE